MSRNRLTQQEECDEVSEEVTLTWVLNDTQEQGQLNWAVEI